MKIIAYRNAMDIDIEFEDGYISKNKQYANFKKGSIKNLYDKIIYNIGYLGEGNYKTIKKTHVPTIQYRTWKDMLRRCYDEENRNKYPSYINCSVCDEWHNFQNFARWYDENYYKCDNGRVHLEKDILTKGNKIYSPETCVFVPEKINYLFLKANNKRGEYPVGVCLDNNRIRVKLQKNQKIFNIGYYKTSEEAFNAYKTEKEKYIKEVADQYKDKIPKKLYDAMYKYEVEITD